MSNRNKGKYFSVKDLKQIEKGCDYLFLLGERSNGKSYAVKENVLTQAYDAINEDGICTKQLAYIRRFDLDCKDSVCEPYFADMPVSTITNGDYTLISVYRKKIYFANIDEKGKVNRQICIGQCFALSAAEHYKSLMFPFIMNVIYEEVISLNNQYLYNEPSQLQQIISSILRDRRGKIYLIGNTISRFCPYYREFGFEDVDRLEEGTGQLYVFNDTKIRVYRTKSRNYNSGLFFGNAAKNITQGEYVTEEQPHLQHRFNDYMILYSAVLEYENRCYLMQLLRYKNDPKIITWYVQPKTTPVQPKTRVISNRYNPDPLYSNGFLPFTNTEQKIFNMLLRENRVCFSDNLTGTEFKNILKVFK